MRARTTVGAREGGQSTVELALLLPVLVLLLLTVLQVGLVARDIVLVTHAAREAARAAAVDPARGAARAAALRGSGLRPDDLTVRVLGRTGPSGRVTVILKYHPTDAVPLVGQWVANRTITATATMRVESSSPDHEEREPARIGQSPCSPARFLSKTTPSEQDPEAPVANRSLPKRGPTGLFTTLGDAGYAPFIGNVALVPTDQAHQPEDRTC